MREVLPHAEHSEIEKRKEPAAPEMSENRTEDTSVRFARCSGANQHRTASAAKKRVVIICMS